MSMFTKRHCVAITEVLRILAFRQSGTPRNQAAHRDTTDEFADMLERDNSLFDRDRFMRAVYGGQDDE